MSGAFSRAALALLAGVGGTAQTVPPVDSTVLELRQYKIVHGQRDAFIALFDREFVEPQEAVGIRLIGQFRDRGNGDRFTWIREFPDMAARKKALSAFYSGPVWQAHRGVANPMLEDNDNVLLLRAAAPGLGFSPSNRPVPGGSTSKEREGLVVVTIYYLWKDPSEGFTQYFTSTMMPELRAAGLPVIAAFVPERTPNNFPRLPVRQNENVFVWFTRVASANQLAVSQRKLTGRPMWHKEVGPRLENFEERATQQLLLEPTSRSALR